MQQFDGHQIERVEDYAYRQGVAGRTANEITADDHVDVLVLASRYVDSAVSKTCNVGDDVATTTSKNCTSKHGEGDALASPRSVHQANATAY